MLVCVCDLEFFGYRYHDLNGFCIHLLYLSEVIILSFPGLQVINKGNLILSGNYG